ncbi:MAG: hypothetical protein ACPLRP_02975, partial [Candidatus Bipolaricaulaceae bacterium]
SPEHPLPAAGKAPKGKPFVPSPWVLRFPTTLKPNHLEEPPFGFIVHYYEIETGIIKEKT